MSTSFPGLGVLAALHERVLAYRETQSGKIPPRRLSRPVVSVGNLVVGGTGKTPFVEALARTLSDEGFITCILSRGYRGERTADPMIVSDLKHIHHGPSEAGDEPYLLARMLPGVPVVVGTDRFEAGELALRSFPVHLFLLDDGFQHRKLHRDLDLVLVDATDPWGGDALLPAGRLREPKTALSRAHAVGLTRLHRVQAAGLDVIKAELARIAPEVPVFGVLSETTGVRRLPRGPISSLEEIKDRRVLAFAGLANPEPFFADLRDAGAQMGAWRTFRDHHPYSSDDLEGLLREASDSGCSALVTTEKDAVRLPQPPRHGMPVYALRQRTSMQQPEAVLRFMLSKLPGPTRGGQALR